jgi:glycosyltransferase involved in cell wall biosynthesis
MKVLLASDFYYPFVGGAERQVQLLAAALADLGHEVCVATVWHKDLPERELSGQVEVHRLRSRLLGQPWFSTDPKRRFHPPFAVPEIARGLRAVIRAESVNVVHANGWIAYSCARALRGTSLPMVVSVRDYGYACAVRTLMHHGRHVCSGPELRKCLRCSGEQYGPAKAVAAVGGVFHGRDGLIRRTSAFHAVSSYVRSTLMRDLSPSATSGMPPVSIIGDIAPTAPTGRAFPEVQPMGELLPAEPFMLFVGQLNWHKGISWMLEAYARLADRPPLVLIGGSWPDTPKSLPPGVIKLGEAPHSVVMGAWQRCLFGIVPSVWPDPLPGVVREAMSCSKPVIGTSIGGITDMIEDGVNGLLVAPGDVTALTDAMSRLLADASLRDRLGRAGRASTERFTPAYVGGKFARLYREVGGEPTSSS